MDGWMECILCTLRRTESIDYKLMNTQSTSSGAYSAIGLLHSPSAYATQSDRFMTSFCV